MGRQLLDVENGKAGAGKRIPLMFAVVGLMYARFPWSATLAFWLFIIAALTDWLDGKIARARAILDRAGSKAHLQVDGGVTADNAAACVRAGADALVAGTAVFRGGPDAYAANIKALKAA